jgi:uncharacterized membrane protein
MKELKLAQIEKDVEVIMGNLLRIGVIIAASVVFIGGVFYLLKYGNSIPSYKFFKGEPSDLKNLTKIFSDAFSFQRRGIIQLGLILLIATPVARVIFSVAAFLYEKDYMYVVFTLIVLAILLFSIFS